MSIPLKLSEIFGEQLKDEGDEFTGEGKVTVENVEGIDALEFNISAAVSAATTTAKNNMTDWM